MALKEMTENVEIVQTLSTYPNQEDGLSAEELKAKFDAGAKAIKEYLNGQVVPAVQELERVVDPGMAYGLDPTLTVAGRAADAAAVGNRFANLKAEDVGARPDTWMPSIEDIGAAPAGYGYGEALTPLEGTESEIKAQFKTLMESMPDGSMRQVSFILSHDSFYGAGIFHGTLSKYSRTYAVVHASTYGYDSSKCLYTVSTVMLAGAWQPFEWGNPPMIVGVEYRTTERWQGKPVYTKVIDCGYLPNATSKDISHGISISTPLDYYGTILTANQAAVANNNVSVLFTKSAIRLTTQSDISDCSLLLALKYTKD